MEVAENETLLVTCIAFGLPSPVIAWTQNDHLLASTTSTDTATTIHNEVTVRGGVRLVKSTLEICNVQGIASGEYKCIAENEFGSQNVSFAITRKGMSCGRKYMYCYSIGMYVTGNRKSAPFYKFLFHYLLYKIIFSFYFIFFLVFD